MGSALPGNFFPAPISEGAKCVPSPLGPWQAEHPCETNRARPAVGCAPPNAVAGKTPVVGVVVLVGTEAFAEGGGGSGEAEAFATAMLPAGSFPGLGPASVRR